MKKVVLSFLVLTLVILLASSVLATPSARTPYCNIKGLVKSTLNIGGGNYDIQFRITSSKAIKGAPATGTTCSQSFPIGSEITHTVSVNNKIPTIGKNIKLKTAPDQISIR